MYQLFNTIKLSLLPVQDTSILFQKPIQISPPSTPEEIYRIQPKSIRSTLHNKNTNVSSSNSNSQRIPHQKISFHLPKFPKSVSPSNLQQYRFPFRQKGYTQNNIESPTSIREPNRRATKLCSKVLQKYKQKYCI
ncbi:unnamed protein product (macronuclear) [Paramecium tetraurelia]|uniref:Uncharacterized protein n=1 Tax=Paramecium tetraurelia TaxID=5888 RepID=A0E7F0_PARTE|nr:uncharacterized protein GSPATT00023945001 [Paramecium tetraurelia]CAK91217.1 unnamed protein product [Paramecium tetraurelia]|eukprot:XP_001458614.1 hypothetical protein (macronuclear) [Paramecium tetraurelia strain d4-2]